MADFIVLAFSHLEATVFWPLRCSLYYFFSTLKCLMDLQQILPSFWCVAVVDTTLTKEEKTKIKCCQKEKQMYMFEIISWCYIFSVSDRLKMFFPILTSDVFCFFFSKYALLSSVHNLLSGQLFLFKFFFCYRQV